MSKKTGARKTYHITPTEDDRWRVKAEGAERAVKVYDTKAEAVDRGRDLAKSQEKG